VGGKDFISIVLLFATLFGGAAIFWAMMGYEMDPGDDNLGWTYINCIYFTAQMLCTVGMQCPPFVSDGWMVD
jgi:hypothetical protein